MERLVLLCRCKHINTATWVQWKKCRVATIVQEDSSLISTLWLLFPKPDSSYITPSSGSSQEGVKHLKPFTFDSENRDLLLSLSVFDVEWRAKVNRLNPSNFSLNHLWRIKNFLTHAEKQPGTQGWDYLRLRLRPPHAERKLETRRLTESQWDGAWITMTWAKRGGRHQHGPTCHSSPSPEERGVKVMGVYQNVTSLLQRVI